jgi:hypothetical protein
MKKELFEILKLLMREYSKMTSMKIVSSVLLIALLSVTGSRGYGAKYKKKC